MISVSQPGTNLTFVSNFEESTEMQPTWTCSFLSLCTLNIPSPDTWVPEVMGQKDHDPFEGRTVSFHL